MKFNRQSISNTLLLALKQGTSPQKLALTCALGAVIGIFPMFGTTTLICFGVAILFRLNIAIIQLVNYVMTALQVLMIIPFIEAGIFIFGHEPFAYTEEQFIELIKNDIWKLIGESGLLVASGILAWLLLAVPLFFIVYRLCLFLFTKWQRE